MKSGVQGIGCPGTEPGSMRLWPGCLPWSRQPCAEKSPRLAYQGHGQGEIGGVERLQSSPQQAMKVVQHVNFELVMLDADLVS